MGVVQTGVTQAPRLFKSWTAVHLRHAALGSEGLRMSTVRGRDRDQLVAENLHGIQDAVVGDLGSTREVTHVAGLYGDTAGLMTGVLGFIGEGLAGPG